MTKIANSTAKLQKEFGKEIGGKGAEYETVDRIPTGWFQFDVGSGGGFPRGMVSMVYGPEGCGKTTLSYRLIAQHQKRYPGLVCCVVDVEHVFAPDWAKAMGVDCDALYVFRPDFVEQCGDVVETLLYSEDCGLVVIDSLAALETSKAIREPMEKFQVAGASVMIKRMCNKVTAALRQSYKEERAPPTVLFINQIRFKIGVVFGNPETMPGGQTPRFTSSFTVRIWGKPVKDEAISKVLPARREMQTQIRKNRIQITASVAKWEMNLIPTPLYPIGECDDWKAIKSYLEHFGLAKQVGKTYDLMLADGEVMEFATQKELRERLVTDQPLMDYVRAAVIRCLIDAEDD